MAPIGFALLALTALLGSAALRPKGFAAFLLAAYLLAAAEVVTLTLALSPFHAVEASGYLLGEIVVAIPVAAAWWALGRPLPRLPLHRGVGAERHPLLV